MDGTFGTVTITGQMKKQWKDTSRKLWSLSLTQKRIPEVRTEHPAIVLFDGFKGQMTDNVHSLLVANNIVAIQLPPNCTDKLQPLDLCVNKPVKDGMKAKFQQWYADEASQNSRWSCQYIGGNGSRRRNSCCQRCFKARASWRPYWDY